MQRPSRYLIVALAGFGLLMSVQAQAVTTDLEREALFDLPQQPLEKALLGFSEQAHVQLLTSSANIPDQIAGGVSGRMRIRRALTNCCMEPACATR